MQMSYADFVYAVLLYQIFDYNGVIFYNNGVGFN